MSPIVETIECSQLENADAATLRWLWAEIKGSDPPRTFTARLMRLALAWEAQSNAQGCEAARSRRDWNRIIRRTSGTGANKRVEAAPGRSVCDGTRILKDWGGTTHEVLITARGGAIWNGQSYSSLSAVARAMTGTNRNGPKFFGLREEVKS
ncbi:hypothetical protein ROA7450_03220 [Roseovarius albus]|uniref:DUF2924 domain-containing protein n=1 Tax=Roseovarius albus TaxID=1247867 RepID=A0A1X6ZUF9_9RHOB|nr:DUF2924 domain-containing protein [Roseovarius albus]SLN61819.1 hypothetical protein ROA7450_03220 [Roseovarius albus]